MKVSESCSCSATVSVAGTAGKVRAAVEAWRKDHKHEPSTSDDRGDCVTFPIGFTPDHGDQRWERGADL